MVLVLKVLGWLGLAIAGINAAIKIFAHDEMALRYAGPSRDLDVNISIFGGFLGERSLLVSRKS